MSGGPNITPPTPPSGGGSTPGSSNAGRPGNPGSGAGGSTPGGASGSSGGAATPKPSSRDVGNSQSGGASRPPAGAKPGGGAGKPGAPQPGGGQPGGKPDAGAAKGEKGGKSAEGASKGKPTSSQAGGKTSGGNQAGQSPQQSRGEQMAREAGKQGARAGKEYADKATGGLTKLIPKSVVDKVGSVAGGAAYKSVVFVAGLLFLVVFGLVGGVSLGGGAVNMASAPSAAERFEKFPTKQFEAYRIAVTAFSSSEKYGGEIPWGLLAGIAELASEHGKLSPYLDDLCDRNPDQPLQRGRVGLSTTACGSTRASSFPTVTPAIGGKPDARQSAFGPFLLLPGAVAANKSVDPQRMDARDRFRSPRTATEFIAKEMDRIRRQMVDVEGRTAPEPGDADGAKRFWGEVVARLPISDPAATACVPPLLSVNADRGQIGVAISTTWHCELLQQELFRYDTTGTESRLNTDSTSEVIAEAIDVAWWFSRHGEGLTRDGAPTGCSRTTVTNSDGTSTTKLTVSVGDTEPAGVFPLDKSTFEKFAPASGVSLGRCDAASNIVAAVRAFISVESTPWEERDGTPYERAAGGWLRLPWVLGNDATRKQFAENGPHRALEPTGRDAACAAAVERWLDGIAANGALFQGLEALSLISETNPDANSNGVADALEARRAELEPALMMNDPRGRGKPCGERTDGAVERLAGVVAFGRLNVKTSPDGSVVETGDNGEPPLSSDTSQVVVQTTIAPQPVQLTPEQLAADATYRGVSAAMEMLAALSPQSSTLALRPGEDIAIRRLSTNGRLGEQPPYPAVPATSYVAQILILGQALSPLVEDDPGHRPDITEAELQAVLDSVLPGEFATAAGGSIAGAPAVLLDAVQKAVATGKADPRFSKCTADAAILMGVAYTESRGSWTRIQPNGDMVPRLLSSARAEASDNDSGYYDQNATEDYAIGAFQITPGNWVGYRSVYPGVDPAKPSTWGGSSVGSDANGDGVADMNNVFDGALGAWKMICKNAGARNLLVWGNEFVESFGPYVSGSKWNSTEVRGDNCYGNPEFRVWKDCTVWLAKKKYDQAVLFRAQLSGAFVPSGGSFPKSVEGAIAWARSQIGAPYASTPYRFGQPWPAGAGPFVSANGSGTLFGPFPAGTATYDCSGYATVFWRKAGVEFPAAATTTLGMRNLFPAVTGGPSEWQPGDLLLSDTRNLGRPSHVQVYIGNGRKIEAGGKQGVYESPVVVDIVKWVVRPPQPAGNRG